MHQHTFQGVADLLALHQAHPTRYPYLLESVAPSAQHRYSLLFAFPQQTLALASLAEASFCNRLDAAWQEAAGQQPEIDTGRLPFRGGWLLYLSYELAGQLEPTLRLPTPQAMPLALAVRIPAAIIIDHLQQQTVVWAEPGFASAFADMLADVAALGNGAPPPSALWASTAVEEEAAERFLAGVARIREYIAAGDVFQVNLSRPWQADLPAGVGAGELYHRLRSANPAPFACLADFGSFAIASSSPERLVRVQDGWVETRPIAGTRPRSDDPARDHALLQELVAHPKERAEHIMLLDLERNDLGRVCQYGSVAVNELMVVESYRHVHHIVSNVRGRLREGVTPGQVIRAVFPGGTITGCPKVRCMEIIAELEQSPRGAYTGSIGYLNHDGSLDLNILIRTFSLHGQRVQFRTGAGIVMDSIPTHELQETRHKARGLLRALGHDVG